MSDIGDLARAVSVLESINDEDLSTDDKNNNRATIERMLVAMEHLINIQGNRAEAEIESMKAQTEDLFRKLRRERTESQ